MTLLEITCKHVCIVVSGHCKGQRCCIPKDVCRVPVATNCMQRWHTGAQHNELRFALGLTADKYIGTLLTGERVRGGHCGTIPPRDPERAAQRLGRGRHMDHALVTGDKLHEDELDNAHERIGVARDPEPRVWQA